MSPNELVDHARQKFQQAAAHFQDEIKKIRTGRAHPGMLDGVTVEAYGTPMPLIQVATITAPEAQLLQISPFDPNNLQAISAAIRDNKSLGLNPMDDGRVVRIQIPPLTTERRSQIAKQLHQKAEETMISLRQARHDALKEIDPFKNKSIGKDEAERLQKQLDDFMNQARDEVERLTRTKEQEIMRT